MSINNIGERDRAKGDVHRGKARGGRPLSPSRLKHGLTRDDIVNDNIDRMARQNGAGEDFIMKKLEASEAKRAGRSSCQTELSARSRNANIFASPKPDEPRRMRLRPDVELGDNAVKQIYMDQNRKESEQAKFTAKPDLIDQMYGCQHPFPHKRNAPQGGRKIDQEQHAVDRGVDNVAGFAGLGQRSKADQPRGLKPARATLSEYAPDFVVRQRHQGVKPFFNPDSTQYNPVTNEPMGLCRKPA